MAIKINKNQNRLEKGFARFDFYFKYNGFQHRQTIKCRKSAVEIHFLEWQNKILNSTNKSANKHKFFEILDEYLEYSKDTKSDRQYKHEKTVIGLVKKFFDSSKPLNEITRADIDSFIMWRKKFSINKYPNTKSQGRITNSTVNRNIAVLSYFFNWAIKKEYYEKLNPCYSQKLKENNRREAMRSPAQIKELLDAAKSIDNRLFQVIAILLSTGMRKGELFSLEWTELDFETQFITLSRHKTKGKKLRMVPITPSLRNLLLTMKDNSINKLVVGSYTVNILKKQWDKLLGKISFPLINDGTKFRVHDLRQVYSQSFLNTGASLEDVQWVLGHQDITTTQRRYAQYARPDLLEKASKIDNVINLSEYY